MKHRRPRRGQSRAPSLRTTNRIECGVLAWERRGGEPERVSERVDVSTRCPRQPCAQHGAKGVADVAPGSSPGSGVSGWCYAYGVWLLTLYQR